MTLELREQAIDYEHSGEGINPRTYDIVMRGVAVGSLEGHKNAEDLFNSVCLTNSYAEYVRNKECDYSDNNLSAEELRVAHGITGVAGEAGELVDALKRRMFYGIKIDRTNIIEECGDVMFYLTLLLDAVDSSVGEAIAVNMKKLDARYATKLTKEECINRDTDNERKIMEETLNASTK